MIGSIDFGDDTDKEVIEVLVQVPVSYSSTAQLLPG